MARSSAGSGPGSPTQYRLPRSGRIHRASDVRALFRFGKKTRMAHVDVFVRPSALPRSRWGVVVPKYRRSIVERNRVKRRLREIGRTKVLPMLNEHGVSFDVLVRARREAYGAGFRMLSEELEVLAEVLCSPE